MRVLIALIICILAGGTAFSASACPAVNGFRDVNCDGKFRVAVLGDSIGRGSRGNLRTAGSFAKRIGKTFPFMQIKNLSIPGLDTPQAIINVDEEFPENAYNVTRAMLKNADFVLVELGINDFYATNDIAATTENLKTIVSLIKAYNVSHDAEAPEVALALVTPVEPVTPIRRQQREFVQELNKNLLAEQSDALPAYVRFDKVTDAMIFADGLHPSSRGHTKMTKILAAYLKKTYQVEETPTPTPG